jgi:hypothetical protein
MDAEIITGIALKKTYGVHAAAVLHDYLEALPRERKKGAKQKYRVKRPLPGVDEFLTMRTKKFTTTLDNLISDAFGELESLRDELQEWYDGMPENFQNGDKGENLQSSIDTLDSLESPDVPEYVTNLEVIYIPAEKLDSRADRRDDAAARLDTAVSVLNDAMDDVDAEVKYTDDQKDEMQELADDLERAKDEAEGVEFPTMYG